MSWSDEKVEVPRGTAMEALDSLARNAEAAYDRAMDTHPGAAGWESFESYTRVMHELAKAIVS